MSTAAIRDGAEPFSLGDGPVGVLMIHGFTGSPASMRPIGEWLALQGLSVEGVRLPGHGTSAEDLRTRRWTEWVDEAARGLDALRARARTVLVFAQSMGASVALVLTASRPAEVDGLALANPYVFDARLLVAPAGRLVLREVKGIENDIAMPGQDENGDKRMPVPAIVEMGTLLRRARSVLPSVRQPAVVFRSGADHVIPRANAHKVLARIGSERTELVACPRSYHVVTLDYDAPLVRERVRSFALELDAGRSG
jgi:carboxylesterase